MIDAANLEKSLKELGWRMDYKNYTGTSKMAVIYKGLYIILLNLIHQTIIIFLLSSKDRNRIKYQRYKND